MRHGVQVNGGGYLYRFIAAFRWEREIWSVHVYLGTLASENPHCNVAAVGWASFGLVCFIFGLALVTFRNGPADGHLWPHGLWLKFGIIIDTPYIFTCDPTH